MARITSPDGVELVCHEGGRSDSRPVMLLHGFSSNASVWTQTRASLAPRCRVLCPDFRGHGDSGRTTEPADFTLEKLAADVMLTAQTLRLGRYTLVGHGMGGYVAQLVALEAPERLDGLVLVGTGPGAFDPAAGYETNRIRLARLVEDKGMSAAWEAYVEAGLIGWELEEVPEEILSSWREEFMKTAPEAFIGLTRSMALQSDRRPRLQRLDLPTMIVVGEDDDAFTEGCRELKAAIAGSRLAIIPGSGHSPQIMEAEAFNDVLLGFLRGLR